MANGEKVPLRSSNGMSFECDTDRFLLRVLHKVEDDMPIGKSHWTIVNPDQKV